MEAHLGHDIGQELALLDAIGQELERRGFGAAPLGVVLGSGLADFGRRMAEPVHAAMQEIPGLPGPRVVGHGAEILEGEIAGAHVVLLTGRVHLYEGWHPWQIVRAVRAFALLGTQRWLLTNAAGGLRPQHGPGTLLAITDHLNLTGVSPLTGPSHPLLGPRFPAMSGLWSPRIAEVLEHCDPGPGLVRGVYAQMAGPSYETPAEVRMLQALGADAVGMSTVPEAVALHAMGCEVGGLSLITNFAAGLTDEPPNHDEVVREGERASARLAQMLTRALPRLV